MTHILGMAARAAEFAAYDRQRFLNRRRMRIRDSLSCVGASFAIAGAAAVSRTTLLSLDDAFRIMAYAKLDGV